MIPLTEKSIYFAKIRIFTEDLLLFFVSCIAVYHLVLFFNDFPLSVRNIPAGFAKGALLLIVLAAVPLLSGILRGIHSEKECD